MLTNIDGFFEIEREMQKQKLQRESVEGKEKPFRVEYRYRGGSKHWVYFTNYEDALKSDCPKKCGYNIWGSPYTEWPISHQHQAKGKRGGWS